MQKNINTQNSPGQGRVGFRELTKRVKLQVEAETFPVRDRAQVDELCYIIAEIYSLHESAQVRIDGEQYSAATIAEVFSLLTAEHLQYVIEHFNNLTYHVTHKKAYLRTALYYSVFELASAAANDAAQNSL